MNTKRIVVKNSDKLTSLVHKRKVVDEYLVYLLDGDTLLSADVVYGEEDKSNLVNQLLKDKCDGAKASDVVVGISFTEFLKQFE